MADCVERFLDIQRQDVKRLVLIFPEADVSVDKQDIVIGRQLDGSILSPDL